MPLASNAQSFEGSTLLAPLSAAVGLSVDKVNFVFAQLASACLGRALLLLAPTAGRRQRQAFHVAASHCLLWFCFGPQLLHLQAQLCVAYALLLLLPRRLSAWLAPVWCLAYLSACHVYRLYNDYGGYTMDITGPLMIQTQKLSALAVALRDAELAEAGHSMRDGRARHCVRQLPGWLDCLSYAHFLPTVMAGPFVFYSDFEQFLDGANGGPADGSLIAAAAHAFAAAAAFGVLQLLLAPLVPYYWVISDGFAQLNPVLKVAYVSASFLLVRCKYYFGWSLAEFACLACGFGFSGRDASGRPQYLLAKSFFLRDVELAPSIRVQVAGWNVPTALWLRELVYERAPRTHATLLTFVVSAIWHGFYPGYYCFFLTFAVFTFAARRVRRVVRPQFQGNWLARRGYDCLTALAANLAQNYAQGVFFLLEMRFALRFWSAMYFSGHILCAALLLCIPSGASQLQVPEIFAQCVPTLRLLPGLLAHRYRQYRRYFRAADLRDAKTS